jgi:hypothetical protein
MTQAQYMPQPGTALKLPANAAVIRMVAGDSLCSGTTSPANTPISDLGETHVRGGAATTASLERGDAYYWSKWFRQDGDTLWSAAYRNLYTSEADNEWLVLHERTGFHAGPGGATYADLGTAPSLGLPWVMHYFANAGPRYEDGQGQRLPIYYIQHGTSASLVGPFATETSTWDPTEAAGLFELWQANYVAPAVNALRAAGKEVYIESMFFTAGGADQNDDAGYPGAENLGQNLLNLLTAMGKRSGGRIPTVMVRPFRTGSTSFPDAEAVLAKTSFDEVFDAFGDPFTDYVRMEGIPTTEATKPGIHPTADGLVMMAQRWADALGRLAARGARLVHVTGDLA